MKTIGDNVVINERSLEFRILDYLKFDARMIDGWKSPLNNDDYWARVQNDAKRLAKEVINEIKFQNNVK